MPMPTRRVSAEALEKAERAFEAQVENRQSGDWQAKLRLIFELESARRRTLPRYLEFIVPQ